MTFSRAYASQLIVSTRPSSERRAGTGWPQSNVPAMLLPEPTAPQAHVRLKSNPTVHQMARFAFCAASVGCARHGAHFHAELKTAAPLTPQSTCQKRPSAQMTLSVAQGQGRSLRHGLHCMSALYRR